MYYQFDSRLNLPAIMFDDDRILVAGKEYFYTDLKNVEITKAPLLATYGIMEIRTQEKSVPVPFAKGDLHRLRTAVQEANHIIQAYENRKAAAVTAAEAAEATHTSGAAAEASRYSGESTTRTTPAFGEAAQTSAEEAQTFGDTAQAEQKRVQPAERRASGLDPYEEMKKLKELLDLDIVTQEEFDRKKKELLGL